MHISVATIDSPEFINLQQVDINPFMSSCDIKVLYVGENRNHSYITKDVATEMAKTLRGAPIVGYFKKDKDDFGDHGQQMVIDDEGIKFNCLTKPYGFVAPDAKVWFQKFEDQDDFGNSVTREYLMTTGYLWTHQFEEAKKAVEEGRPQSMELDDGTLQGKWSTNVNTGVDFFIINDAIFTKLCILGDDVEPCFEGASVTAPDVSTHFTKMDNNFTQTLFTMMQDLKKVVVSEGGQKMALDNTNNPVMDEGKPATNFSENGDNSNEMNPAENENNTDGSAETSFAKKDGEEANKTTNEGEVNSDANNGGEGAKKPADDGSNEDKEKAKKYDLLVAEHEELQAKFTALQGQFDALEAKCNDLTAFKKSIDDAKKKDLIDSFCMLSDEDKKDVVEHFDTYTFDDIKKNLSAICFDKKINFTADTSEQTVKKDEATPSVTYNLNNNGDSSVPAWLSALKNTRDAHKV